jgi:hypothetical protein
MLMGLGCIIIFLGLFLRSIVRGTRNITRPSITKIKWQAQHNDWISAKYAGETLKIPPTTKYLIIDRDGDIYGYTTQPFIDTITIYGDGGILMDDRRIKYFRNPAEDGVHIATVAFNGNWQLSLVNLDNTTAVYKDNVFVDESGWLSVSVICIVGILATYWVLK